jgi:hypothetical protein
MNNRNICIYIKKNKSVYFFYTNVLKKNFIVDFRFPIFLNNIKITLQKLLKNFK